MPAFFLCISLAANAQVRRGTLTVAKGLSQGYATSLIQDTRGFLWIGTFDGLNRYDGYTVRRFLTKPFDPFSLLSSYITYLYEDRNQLIWVGTHQGLQIFDPLTERFYNLSLPEFNLPAGHVRMITADRQGCVFVQISANEDPSALFCLKTPVNLIQRIRQEQKPLEGIKAELIKTSISISQPASLLECIGDTMVLMGGKDGEIFRFSHSEKRLHPFDLRRLPGAQTEDHNLLWGKYVGYFYRWRLPDGRDSVLPYHKWQHAIRMSDGATGLWTYRSDLYRKNSKAQIDFDLFCAEQSLAANSKFQEAFTKWLNGEPDLNQVILADRSGVLWTATGGWGVRRTTPRQISFGSLFAGKSVSSLRELPDGKIWIRFYSDENLVIDAASGKTVSPPWESKFLHGATFFEVFSDSRGNFWLIAPPNERFRGHRFMIVEKNSGQVTHFDHHLPFLEGVPEKIFEDREGNIWIAGHQGNLYRCRPGALSLEHFTFAGFSSQNHLTLRSTAIAQDPNGVIWIGTNRGILKMEAANSSRPHFSFFQNDPNNPHSLSIDWVTSICVDPGDPDVLWLGTRGGGLNRFNNKDQSFSYIPATPDGLSDNVVYGILPDGDGNLWCSTNRGICRYNPQRNTFVSYQESDGLLNTEFNTNSYLRTSDGRFWFGGVNGLNVFRPSDIQASHLPPPVAITGIKVRGAERKPDGEGILSLPFADNNILFEFAALDFANPNTNRFRHRLIGIDKDWVYDGTSHTTNYAALPPGHYILEVQGATSDSPWSEHPVQFKLIIHSPWHRTWIAYLAYLLILVATIWGIIRYSQKMFRLQHLAETNQIESERLKKFELVKNQFFANLAHELRTPLTVILGLAKRLKADSKKEEIEQSAQNIAEQGNTLLNLTNQILDLAKLESQQFILHPSNGNIIQFVQHLTTSLNPLAESKGLQLINQYSEPQVWMDFDPAQIQKILNNLIANAIRHSSAGGKIIISTATESGGAWLKISVQDEGEGIAPEDLPYIFDRFYQGSSSNGKTGASGLGLTLARELVELMGGALRVERSTGKGTLFTISLPIQNELPANTEPEAYIEPVIHYGKSRPAAPSNKSLPLLLVLEDNEAVADFLQLSLQDHFRLEVARDGESGIAKALELVPDLILTDIAMPKKDGFEVTSILKNDLRTSHIPIVMLTAKVETRDRLEGKRRGANAYVTKPFEVQELLFILNNLLHLQQQWKHRYAAPESDRSKWVETDHPREDLRLEDEFMQKLYAVFEAEYAEEGLNLDRLCRLLGMSSSQLDRKLKVLTNKPPMHLLRSFKLHKAKLMLRDEPGLSIKDVCFRTGFKSPAHFSRAFSEEFGVPPSEV